MAERTCSVAGCESASYVRGWCIKHYRRWQRYGDAHQEPVRMPSICTVLECTEPSLARGWCSRHYWRWNNFGAPTGVGPERGPHTLTVTERFWRYVEKTETCWLWVGATSGDDGYGRFNAGTTVAAHRYSWLLDGRTLTPTYDLDHVCRVRLCVRPSHLEEVPHAVNIQRRDEAQRAMR